MERESLPWQEQTRTKTYPPPVTPGLTRTKTCPPPVSPGTTQLLDVDAEYAMAGRVTIMHAELILTPR